MYHVNLWHNWECEEECVRGSFSLGRYQQKCSIIVITSDRW